MNVNVLDAKTNLSKLIQRALNGEDIVLARNGTPAVRLVPISRAKALRPMGLGKIEVDDDFLARSLAPLSAEALSAWYD